ncbi:WD40 repeat domain-containing protein [Actinocorallia aurea]
MHAFDGEVRLRAVAAEGWLLHREVPGWRRPDGRTAFAAGEPGQEWAEPTTAFSPLLGVPVVLAASTVSAKGGRSVIAMHAVPGMELMNAWETGFPYTARHLTAVAADGRCLAAARAPWSPEYRVWDAETGAEVCAWTQEHEGTIAAAEFDGDPLLLTGDGPLVRVRDPRTGAETRRPLVFEGVEEAVSISVAAGYALVAGRLRTGLYPLAGGPPLWTSDGDGPDAPVSGLGLLRGRPVALVNTRGPGAGHPVLTTMLGRLSGPAVVLDLLSGRPVGDPLPCGASGGGFLPAPEGTLAYAALAWSRDDPGDTWVWDPEIPDDAPAWHGGPVRALHCTVLDGAEAAVSLDEDGDAHLWDLDALARDPGAAAGVPLGGDVGALDLVTYGGRPAAVLGGAGWVRLVSLADRAVLAETALAEDEEVTELCHTGGDDDLLILAGVATPDPHSPRRHGSVRAWKPGAAPAPPFGRGFGNGLFRVCALAAMRDGDRTIALRSGEIHNLSPERWSVEDRAYLDTVSTGGDVFAAAATALDGVAHFACTTYAGGVALSRVSDGRIVARLANDSYGVAQALAVSGGTRPLIAATNHFRVLSLWRAPDPSPLSPSGRLAHASLACAWTPSGRLLVGLGPGLALLEPRVRGGAG